MHGQSRVSCPIWKQNHRKLKNTAIQMLKREVEGLEPYNLIGLNQLIYIKFVIPSTLVPCQRTVHIECNDLDGSSLTHTIHVSVVQESLIAMCTAWALHPCHIENLSTSYIRVHLYKPRFK